MDQAEELAMAERHVREGEAIVSRQRRIVDELRRDGHSTATAEQLLAIFESSLKGLLDHLRLVQRESNETQPTGRGLPSRS